MVFVVPYVSPNSNEDADTLAEALVDPKGEWCWEDLVAVNYEFDPVEAQNLSLDLSEEAKKDKVAFWGYKPAK